MAEIKLVNGGVALCDEADLEMLTHYVWRSHSNRYAITTSHGIQRLMHRLILDLKPGEICDHINGDGFDNRRFNLRKASRHQNAWNRKGSDGKYKGVYRIWQYRKTSEGYPVARRYYVAVIIYKGKRITLKQSKDPILCAVFYDLAARQLYGEFARCNFPPDFKYRIPPAQNPRSLWTQTP